METIRTVDVHHFVDDAGAILERSGMPRMAGRIFGLLLITNEPYLPADVIASTLNASRGSVSTMTRLLIQSRLVEKVRQPGSRREYFRVTPGTFTHLLRSKLSQLSELGELVEHGMELVPPSDSGAYGRLLEMRAYYQFFQREWPLLFDRWEKFWKTERLEGDGERTRKGRD